jgi:hypothetical protein
MDWSLRYLGPGLLAYSSLSSLTAHLCISAPVRHRVERCILFCFISSSKRPVVISVVISVVIVLPCSTLLDRSLNRAVAFHLQPPPAQTIRCTRYTSSSSAWRLLRLLRRRQQSRSETAIAGQHHLRDSTKKSTREYRMRGNLRITPIRQRAT